MLYLSNDNDTLVQLREVIFVGLVLRGIQSLFIFLRIILVEIPVTAAILRTIALHQHMVGRPIVNV